MFRKNPAFPNVSRGFWHRFRRRWNGPLGALEQVISLSETFGADPTSHLFDSMDREYWVVLRSLHARTCLHARAALSLLFNGLVDPAWAQWRVCHESTTIARFIADSPKMASRYLHYTVVNKYNLARVLWEIGSKQSPTEAELNVLKSMADSVKEDLKGAYDNPPRSAGYSWSGYASFAEIEAAVSEGDAWNPRGEYILASERVHAAPNAGEPFLLEGTAPVFVVGPKNSGLTGPLDLTSMSVMRATLALILRASCHEEDSNKLRELHSKSRLPGALAWMVDPEIFCTDCGGYVPGASPPEPISEKQKPSPCHCGKPRSRRASWVG